MMIKGIVKKHLGRGKNLGFPTANLEISADIEDGIYMGYTVIAIRPPRRTEKQSQWDRHGLRPRDDEGEELLPSLVFVGASETFGETDRKAEVYILDYNGDLYDQTIEVELIKKIRDNKKFVSKEELIEQMRADERLAREYFKNLSFRPSLPR